MGILDDDVARVREATDLVALAGEHIALKRVGRRFMGLCPFHTEKTPSFSVNPELGVYYCFGCQKSGDSITFIREIEHLDFVEAVERLAARAGITLRYDNVAIACSSRRRRAGRGASTSGPGTSMVTPPVASISVGHRTGTTR
jgi:DNA primase